MTLFNEQDSKEQAKTAGDSSVYFLCFENTRERKMFHFDTEWAYKHLVIIVFVHKMDFGCGIKIAKDDIF